MFGSGSGSGADLVYGDYAAISDQSAAEHISGKNVLENTIKRFQVSTILPNSHATKRHNKYVILSFFSIFIKGLIFTFCPMLLHNPLCPSTCCGYVKAVLLLTNLGPVLVRGGRGGMVWWLERGAPGREAWVWNTMLVYNDSIKHIISTLQNSKKPAYLFWI